MLSRSFESCAYVQYSCQSTCRLRQYRTRISQWKKDKNIKPREMKAIVRKRQHRRLVEGRKAELVFRVRGKEVDAQKIDRWMKRHGISENQLDVPSPTACKSEFIGYNIREMLINCSYSVRCELSNYLRARFSSPENTITSIFNGLARRLYLASPKPKNVIVRLFNYNCEPNPTSEHSYFAKFDSQLWISCKCSSSLSSFCKRRSKPRRSCSQSSPLPPHTNRPRATV